MYFILIVSSSFKCFLKQWWQQQQQPVYWSSPYLVLALSRWPWSIKTIKTASKVNLTVRYHSVRSPQKIEQGIIFRSSRPALPGNVKFSLPQQLEHGIGIKDCRLSKTPIVSPEQVEDGIGAFLPGGRDVDGEAKEARVIAPVQQYLKILLLKQTVHSGGRSLWKLWGRGGGEGSRPNACFSILVLPPCGKDFCLCRWNWNWWSYSTLWALLYWRTSSLPTTLEIGCKVFTTWRLGHWPLSSGTVTMMNWWVRGEPGNVFMKILSQNNGKCLKRRMFTSTAAASGDRKQIKAHKIELLQWQIRREKTSEYAPVEQPWGQEVQLWPKQLQGDPAQEPM